jgi:hypothetical protein
MNKKVRIRLNSWGWAEENAADGPGLGPEDLLDGCCLAARLVMGAKQAPPLRPLLLPMDRYLFGVATLNTVSPALLSTVNSVER